MRGSLEKQRAQAAAQLAQAESAAKAAHTESEGPRRHAAQASQRCDAAEAREAAANARAQHLSRSLAEADASHKVSEKINVVELRSPEVHDGDRAHPLAGGIGPRSLGVLGFSHCQGFRVRTYNWLGALVFSS